MNYKDYSEWKKWNYRDFGVLNSDKTAYFCLELESNGIESIAGKKVLELGFGNGTFSTYALQNGAEYTGTEVQELLVDIALEKNINAVLATTPLPPELMMLKYDLIVAFDVVEHFELCKTRELLKQCTSLLTESGAVLIRIPSGDSPFSRAIQHGDITHKTILGSSAVRQLAEEAGFSECITKGAAQNLVGAGFRSMVRRSLIGLIRKLIYPVVRRVFMGKADAVLTPNMIVLLRK